MIYEHNPSWNFVRASNDELMLKMGGGPPSIPEPAPAPAPPPPPPPPAPEPAPVPEDTTDKKVSDKSRRGPGSAAKSLPTLLSDAISSKNKLLGS